MPTLQQQDMAMDDFRMEAKLLDFYGLEQMFPETWQDPVSTNVALSASPTEDSPRKESISEAGPAAATDLVLSENLDPLGVKTSVSVMKIVSRLTRKQKNQVMTSSSEFDPKKFLLEVHKDTSYADLHKGYQNLLEVVDKRQEILKSLVKTNFDRFVGAKSTVDAIYQELKTRNLETSGDGSEAFLSHVNDACSHSQKLFQPIIERRVKAEKIRSTLNILERYKFFFNLSSSLNDSLKKNRFDQAVHDYKKGKLILNSTRSQASNNVESPFEGANSPGSDSWVSTASAIGLQKVFEKVWKEVEHIVEALRAKMLLLLNDMSLSMDLHERCLGYLMELDVAVDPVWLFLNSHGKWIIKLLEDEYALFVAKMRSLLQDFTDYTGQGQFVNTETATSKEAEMSSEEKHFYSRQQALQSLKFRRALFSNSIQDYGKIFGRDCDTQAWMALFTLFERFAEILQSSFPDFWKVCRNYLEGKYDIKGDRQKKRAAVDQQKGEQCVQMVNQIMESFSKHLLHAASFCIGPKFQRPSSGSDSSDLVDSMGNNANGTAVVDFMNYIRSQLVASCYYLPRLVLSISACQATLTKTLKPLSGSFYVFNDLTKLLAIQGLLEKLKHGFTDLLCFTASRESAKLYTHEDAKHISNDFTSATSSRAGTVVVQMLHKLQKLVLKSLYEIVTESELDHKNEKRHQISAVYLEKIKSCLFENVYVFLDGLHFLAFHPSAWKEWMFIHNGYEVPEMDSVDGKLLLVLGNLDVISTQYSFKWVRFYEELFRTSVSLDKLKLDVVLAHLDRLVFDSYIKRKRLDLIRIVRQGCLYAGYDWKRTTPPTDVQPHVNEVLLNLVAVHADVHRWLGSEVNTLSDVAAIAPEDEAQPVGVAKSISPTRRIFIALLSALVRAFEEVYRDVDGMSPYGGMQAIIDFLALMDIVRGYIDYIPSLAGYERVIFCIVQENIHLVLMTSKQASEIADVAEWLEGQKSDIDTFIARFRECGEVGYKCLKNL